MAKYRYIGDRAETLASGQPIEPGEFITLSDEEAEHPQNQALLAQGTIIPTGSKSQEIADKQAARLAADQKKEGGE